MRKTLFLSLLSVIVISMASCSNDELVPEVSFPEGSVDYFEESIDFDNQAGEKTISFTSNVPWTISVDETRNGSVWCTVSPTQGEAGDATIKIQVDENTSYDDRNAVLRLSYGNSTKNIFVNQKQVDALTLTSDRFEVPAEGGTINVEIKSNVDYAAVIDDDCKNWIHQTSSSSTRGLSTTSLQFQIDPTVEYDQRKGEIVIQSGDKSETVTVYQAGDGILSLTNKEFNLTSSEQDIAIEVSSNFEYEVTMPDVDWISEIQSRGISTHTINLHIAENTAYEGRTATIRLYDKNSDVSEEVIINQSQKNVIDFETREYEFDENGGTFTVDINSNVNYEVEIDANWVTVLPDTRALVKRSHSFNVLPLTENVDRKTKIKFTDSVTGTTEEIVVKQNRSIFFDFDSCELFEGDTHYLNLTNRTDQPVTFTSSDETIVTVSNEGEVKAVAKGKVTVTAATQDGKHKCVCEVVVSDITSYISGEYMGGGSVVINGIIQSGSRLNWRFVNNSSKSVVLKSLQLIGGDGSESNLMDVNVPVNAFSSVAYTTTIGLFGMHDPVTCRFRFEYNGKEYFVDAVSIFKLD